MISSAMKTSMYGNKERAIEIGHRTFNLENTEYRRATLLGRGKPELIEMSCRIFIN